MAGEIVTRKKEHEVWVPVIGYEGRYEVSNLGRVKSVDRVNIRKCKHGEFEYKASGKILKPQLKRSGYYQVNLYSGEKKMKSKPVHRIVLESFTGKKDGMTVNHINEVKTDNRLENLEWMTYQENISYSSSRPIACFDANTSELVKLYPSISSVRKDGHDMRAVCHCCEGVRRWSTHHGFVWRWLDVKE